MSGWGVIEFFFPPRSRIPPHGSNKSPATRLKPREECPPVRINRPRISLVLVIQELDVFCVRTIDKIEGREIEWFHGRSMSYRPAKRKRIGGLEIIVSRGVFNVPLKVASVVAIGCGCWNC